MIKRIKDRPLTSSESIERARSFLGKPIKYQLGTGGRDPNAKSPSTTRDGKVGCDCVGFVAWACGFDRLQPDFPHYGGWINCDSALGKFDSLRGWHGVAGFFDVVQNPNPGDWVVYPSIDLDHDGARDRIGHVALVTEVGESWAFENIKVIQCSSAASRKGASSIVETNATLWGNSSTYKGRTEARWGATFLRPLI